MTYQYQYLTDEERVAQIDANLPQLEQMLFQSEMSLRMNAHRPDEDEAKIALVNQYEDHLTAIQALAALRIEIVGNGIVSDVIEGARRPYGL